MDLHNDQYYIRGQMLARKVVSDILANPERAETHARIWVPACLAAAPDAQKLGFLDIAQQAECIELEQAIIEALPFILHCPETLEQKAVVLRGLRSYYERLLA